MKRGARPISGLFGGWTALTVFGAVAPFVALAFWLTEHRAPAVT